MKTDTHKTPVSAPEQPKRPRRILREEDLRPFIGNLKRTAIREMCEKGELPMPIKISDSGRARGWFEDEIIAWQEKRAEQGRTVPG